MRNGWAHALRATAAGAAAAGGCLAVRQRRGISEIAHDLRVSEALVRRRVWWNRGAAGRLAGAAQPSSGSAGARSEEGPDPVPVRGHRETRLSNLEQSLGERCGQHPSA